jgi:hypothetical protein
MKGFVVSLTVVAGIAVVLLFVMLAFSFFTGGSRTSSVLGMQGTLLEGIDNLVTGIYNSMIVLASWVTIFVLLGVFLAVQGIFIYFYYQLGKIFWTFKDDVEKIVDELLNV